MSLLAARLVAVLERDDRSLEEKKHQNHTEIMYEDLMKNFYNPHVFQKSSLDMTCRAGSVNWMICAEHRRTPRGSSILEMERGRSFSLEV